VISLAAWLITFTHPLPYWDQWNFILDYVVRQESGDSWLRFFFAQHNEHRIAVPRLFFITDLEQFGGRNSSLVIANVTIQLLSWVGLCCLIWPRIQSTLNRITAMALALVVLFSAAQAENFIWGFQVQFVGVYAAGIWACICVMSNRPALACVLAIVATLMMANGLFIWPVLLLLSCIVGKTKKTLLIYGVGFVICLVAYLFSYKSVGNHTSAIYSLTHPVEFVCYLAAFLGSAGGLERPGLAIGVGTGGIVLFCAMTLRAWQQRTIQPPQFWTLWSVAVFVLISAGITTVGRMSFGVEQALASRYVTPSSVFLVSLVFAWLSLAKPQAANRAGVQTSMGMVIDGVLAALLLTVIVLVSMNHMRNKSELAGKHQRLDMASDAIATGVQDLRVYGMTYNDAMVVNRGADWLKSAKLSIFSQRPWSLLGAKVGVDIPIAPEGRCSGQIDTAKPFAGEARSRSATQVTGWAWDVQARRRPAHVLLVDAANRVTGFASEMLPRHDVVLALRMPRAVTSGWSGYDSQAVPVAAYGLVDDGELACKL